MTSSGSLSRPVTVNELLDGHAVLDVECLDRIYLNTYVPNLQVGGQIARFLTEREGAAIPSPALLEKRGTAFRRAVESFAANNNIPVVQFAKTDRKIDVMRPVMAKAASTGRSQVVAIGVAQEFQKVTATTKSTRGNAVQFGFYKADRRVTCYYFYLWDEDFGPAFIKVCAYFPYPGKIWVNGHEWAKRQAAKAGIRFTELSNGFASCDDAARLQAICDRLGPGTITVFAERWWARLPLPFNAADRMAGYWWEISMRQVETSRTIVLDAPRRARAFFEALVADNLDLGRPDHVDLLFKRSPRGIKANPPRDGFKTAIDRDNNGVVINAFYKHSRIKQYLKDGRALRIETVINDPTDLGVLRRLEHLDDLQARSRDANRRLLQTERVGQGYGGQRAPALRFGDPRVQALAGALAATIHTVTGTVTNKSLRAMVTALLGEDGYTANRMSYDLRRLRLKGLIERVDGTNAYRITPAGQRFAVFYTKVHNRLLGPLLAANAPPAPPDIRQALRLLDQHIDRTIDLARLPRPA